MTDLNTLDDWWNEGFDDFFSGAPIGENVELSESEKNRLAWVDGWYAAQTYRNAMKEQGHD